MRKRFWRWVALYAAKKAGLPVERRHTAAVNWNPPVVNKPLDTAYAQMGPPTQRRRSAMDRYNWETEES
jgi:hypothetical protein